MKEAVSSCQHVRPWLEGMRREGGLGLLEGGRNADCVTDKKLVRGLNKGARTYVINAINTVIRVYVNFLFNLKMYLLIYFGNICN